MLNASTVTQDARWLFDVPGEAHKSWVTVIENPSGEFPFTFVLECPVYRPVLGAELADATAAENAAAEDVNMTSESARRGTNLEDATMQWQGRVIAGRNINLLNRRTGRPVSTLLEGPSDAHDGSCQASCASDSVLALKDRCVDGAANIAWAVQGGSSSSPRNWDRDLGPGSCAASLAWWISGQVTSDEALLHWESGRVLRQIPV